MSSSKKNSPPPAVLTPSSADLRNAIGNQKPQGCDLLRAGVMLGIERGAAIVIVQDSAFSSSSYGYSGSAVLVDTSFKNIPPENRLVGKSSIPVPGNTYVVLKQEFARPYLKALE